MNLQKKNLMITYDNEFCYRVYIRKRVFLFFDKWVPLTYQETENSDEHIIEYRSFDEAKNFIDRITSRTLVQ